MRKTKTVALANGASKQGAPGTGEQEREGRLAAPGS